MSAHSKGPWEYQGDESGEIAIVSSVNLGGRRDIICSDVDRMANARLIAAAPDLLEALRVIVGILPDGLGVTDAFKLFGQLAIMKAVGEPVAPG